VARTNWAPPPKNRADKVLDVALRLFDGVGYEMTTIEDIRLQAEVSTGSIYHHFGSKERIAAVVYVRALRGLHLGFRSAICRRGAEEAIRAGVGYYLSWADDHPAEARFLLRRREIELLRPSREVVHVIARDTLEAVERWYQPWVEAGRVRDMPLPLFQAIWLGAALEHVRFSLERDRRVKVVEAEPVLAEAAWRALRSSR
jgi:AcrR family transcriptional regulator